MSSYPPRKEKQLRGPLITKERVQAKAVAPLYNAQAEQAVLGSMLAHPDEVIDNVMDALRREDFFVPAHQEVFTAIYEVHKEKGAVDITTIHDWLAIRHLAETIGGYGLLAELAANIVTHLNVASHVLIVRQKSILRAVQKGCVDIVQQISNGEKDADEILDEASRIITAIGISQETASQPFAIEAENVLKEALSWSLVQRPMRGFDTGFEKLNELTTGWMPGDFVVLGARPGKGKTALMLVFVMVLCRLGYAVQMFSLEMGKPQLIIRLAAMHCGISLQNLRHGRLSESEIPKLQFAMEEIKAWPLYIEDDPHQNMDRIRSKMRQGKRKNGIQVAFIDYIGLIEPFDRRQERKEYIPDISRGIKNTAKELQIPIIVAAQLNRYAAEGEPQEHHIADSDAIARDADMVMLLHENPAGEAKDGPNIPYNLILTKQRNGPTDKVPLMYSSWRALFMETKK